MEIKEKITHPISIVALIGALGLGGGTSILWEPATKLVQSLTNRLDIIIYLMADENEAVVNESWDHIISKRVKSKLRNGE